MTAPKNLPDHSIKIAPEWMEAIVEDGKRFEVRRADRPYKVGDTVELREYVGDGYTGYTIFVRITCILRHEDFPIGIRPDYCVFGFEVLE